MAREVGCVVGCTMGTAEVGSRQATVLDTRQAGIRAPLPPSPPPPSPHPPIPSPLPPFPLPLLSPSRSIPPPQLFLSADILLRRTPAAHGRRGPARVTINLLEPLVSSTSAQPRWPLSARARRGGAFSADDPPGLPRTATRIQRRDPVAPVSRRGREDLWPFSAASGASRASDLNLLASLHGKSRSITTPALPPLHFGGDQGCGCRHGLLYLLYGRRSVSSCAFSPLPFSLTHPAPSSTRRRSSALPGPLDLLRVP